MARVHIIGAGLAGLSAAVRLAADGCDVAVYEASPHAGGRCRSYHDPILGCRLDNGNHLVLSGNHDVMDYLDLIGSRSQLQPAATDAFAFVDLASSQRFHVRLSDGLWPGWIFNAKRRPPNTHPWHFLSLLKPLLAADTRTVTDMVADHDPLYRSFWEPFTLAVLNTQPADAAVALLRPVLLETFGRGWAKSMPMMTHNGLGAAFVEPALSFLARAGVDVRFGARVRSLSIADTRVTALHFAQDNLSVARDDQVILAVPAWIAPELVPGLSAPPAGEPIVNVHFRLSKPFAAPDLLGVLGGLTQWIFVHDDIASVTISAAAACVEWEAERIAAQCWREVATALGLPADPMLPVRVVKERRATFAQTPEALAARPPAQTKYTNLILAGDWTATGLPATIEGTLRSGRTAAHLAGARNSR